jgi:hypothetical protein
MFMSEDEHIVGNAAAFAAMDFPTAEDIKKMSSIDGLGSAVAIFQVLWFGIQIIGRAAEGLSITEIEIETVCFLLLTLMTTGFWWYKPSDLQTETLIDPSRVEFLAAQVKDQGTKLRMMGPTYADYNFYVPVKKTFVIGDEKPENPTGWRDEIGAERVLDIAGVQSFTLGMFSAAIFGIFHATAWFFSFPTVTEMWLWRICTIVMTGLPVLGFAALMVLVVVGGDHPGCWMDRHFERLYKAISGVVVVVYGVARMIILVQCFLCFRSMPSDAYETPVWLENILHI